MPENEQFQKDWLRKKGYRIINSLMNTFKNHRDSDEVCKLIYEMMRNKQDLDSLFFMISQWGGRDKTYPFYFGFGTITSRITMRQPSLQNMRRANRSIIKADLGKKLLYIDYSQFEAGILASLSDDKELINLYNIDIYKDLAKFVFNDESEEGRKNAKIIFYRYMYGDKTLNIKAKEYFNKFGSLKKFVSQVEIDMQKNSSIGTSLGNFRNATSKESTWALSHKIQATASLIFKKALIRVYKEVNDAEFLIPMHDAALYQVNDAAYGSSKEKIETIFKDEFKKACPQITPKVNIGNW
ncbi:DNA polymerase I [termite gut metagenome]|uniref:DNA polymerase I n=1 Tax=termite gut metagenome TaxID=433724 RepID=A0A5J4PZT7_9ZZZZ